MKKTYSRERMTNLAAFVSLIQATIYIGFIIYFLEVLMSKDKVPLERHRIILHHLTSKVRTLFLAALFFAGFLHVLWLGSSIYALLGNKNGNERSVSQYVTITMLVNLMDIIMPFIVLPTTFSVFALAMVKQTIEYENTEEPVLLNEKDYGTYFWLLMVFIRGGCFTFAIDILSTTVAYQRFLQLHEMRVKSRGNVGLAEIGGIPRFTLNDDIIITPYMEKSKDDTPSTSEANNETTYVPSVTRETQLGVEEPEVDQEDNRRGKD